MNPRTVEGLLAKTYPDNPRVEGRWVYQKEQADVQRLIKPRVTALIPEYSFYTVTLINYQGSLVNRSRILFLYDSVNISVFQTTLFWFGLQSRDMLGRIVGKTFPDSTALVDFMLELQSLINTGSNGGFENMFFNQDKISFDLTGPGNNPKPVWEHYEMFINNNTIRSFRVTNPNIKWRVTVE